MPSTVDGRTALQPILFHEFDIMPVVAACPDCFQRSLLGDGRRRGHRMAGAQEDGWGLWGLQTRPYFPLCPSPGLWPPSPVPTGEGLSGGVGVKDACELAR